jgi:hypothetical protein
MEMHVHWPQHRQAGRMTPQATEHTCLQDVSMSWSAQARGEMPHNQQGISISIETVDH